MKNSIEIKFVNTFPEVKFKGTVTSREIEKAISILSHYASIQSTPTVSVVENELMLPILTDAELY